MKLLETIGRVLRPGSARQLQQPNEWFRDAVVGPTVTAGVPVSPRSALGLIPVYAAVRVIAEALASLPLVVVREEGANRTRQPDHPLAPMLGDEPNPEMSSVDLRDALQGHALLWGNGMAEIERDSRGAPVGLWPMLPDRTTVERMKVHETGETLIVYSDTKTGRLLDSSDVVHVHGRGFDGLVGYSPVRLAREGIGLGMAVEQYGAAFFGNRSQPAGVLAHPKRLSPEARDNLRTSWDEQHKGSAKSHRTAILEEGVTWTQIGIPPEDAQFLETRRFQVHEIARLFGVPPHLIGDLDRATFSNIESQGIDFVVHCLRPWLVRWEAELNRKLFRGTPFRATFVVEGLLRGDQAARAQFYRELFAVGAMTQNEIRASEDMGPIPGGDVAYVPLNLQPTGEPRPDDQGDPEDRAAPEPAEPNLRPFLRIAAHATEAIATKERNAVRRAAKSAGDDEAAFAASLERFYSRGRVDEIVARLLPVAETVLELASRGAAGAPVLRVGSIRLDVAETVVRDFAESECRLGPPALAAAFREGALERVANERVSTRSVQSAETLVERLVSLAAPAGAEESTS